MYDMNQRAYLISSLLVLYQYLEGWVNGRKGIRGDTDLPGLSRKPPNFTWQQPSIYLVNPSR